MNNPEDQPKPKSDRDHEKVGDPLITRDWGPIVGALITAAASLLLYSFQQIRHIDERLDTLEREAAALIQNGQITPSREALENKYHLEAIARRVERLEESK